jgi:tRNA threonylcarbamoyladenosine biosynthesis protein TsaE
VSATTVLTRSADETRDVGRAAAGLLEAGDVVIVAGELGSGKTTFVQGLAAGVGITDAVVSPTFTIAREYVGSVRLVHVDVYRLDRAQELLDLGLEDLADDAVLVVEWGDVAAGYLPADHLAVRLGPGPGADPDERTVSLTAAGPSWDVRADEVAAALGAR